MIKMLPLALSALIAAVGAGAQGPAECVITIGTGDVTAYTPTSVETGKYYRLDFQVPRTGSAATLETALLEFYVDAESLVRGDFRWLDADSVEHVGYTARAPVIEVFALTSAIEGEVEEAQLDAATSVRRPVAVGSNRRVVIDIAPIVRSFMEDPSKNRGIVIGSFLGLREGDFTLAEVLEDGSLARIRLEFSPDR